MASPPSPLMQCDTTSSLARMLSPKMMKRSSPNEWSGSSIIRAYGSSKTVVASSNVTPCLAALVAALAWSHSNLVRLVSRPYAWHNYRVTIPSTSRNTRQSPTGCHPVPHVARPTGERRPESRLFRKTMLEASDSPLCLKLTEKSPDDACNLPASREEVLCGLGTKDEPRVLRYLLPPSRRPKTVPRRAPDGGEIGANLFVRASLNAWRKYSISEDT